MDRPAGVLVGLAVGDALGFPLEGLSAGRISRRFGRPDRFRFLGSTGYVSDDTEQTVMVAEAILKARGDPEQAARLLGRALVGWFWTVPPGVGMATARACLRLSVGLSGGVRSAGNGAAMRAAAVGLWPGEREALGRALARITHTDPRGVDGAVAVARAVALVVQGEECPLERLSDLDFRLVENLEVAWRLRDPQAFAQQVGASGYVLHSVPLAFACLWADPPEYLSGLQAVLACGGDADSNGAIAGALLGARFGLEGIPSALAERLEPCFSARRLAALAHALTEGAPPPPRPGSLALRSRELLIKSGVALHVLQRLLP